MGCDIHVDIEYTEYEDQKTGQPMWWHFCEFFFPRNYYLFTAIAGVRDYNDGIEPVVEPRGMPKNATLETLRRYSHYVGRAGESAVSFEQAEEWVSRDWSEWIEINGDPHAKVSSPDWHHPGWLTAGELEEALRRAHAVYANDPNNLPTDDMQVKAAIAAMRVFEAAGSRCRMTFFFDN